MAGEWRVTAAGEKQWRGADGNWYSTEQLAATAGTSRTPPALPFPGVYRRPTKRRRVSRQRLAVLLVVGVAIVGVLIVVNLRSQSPPYKVDMLTVKVLNPQHVDVEYRVHNLGSSAWQPHCSVQIVAHFGGGVGTAIQSSYGPIDAGEYGDVGGIITISNNDANAVTRQEVSISDC